MKHGVFLVATATILALAGTVRANHGGTTLYQEIDRHVVCVHTLLKNGDALMGTGFFIAPDLVATVAHQVLGADTITLHLPDGRKAKVEPVVVREAWDLALLRTPKTALDGLPLSSASQPDMGEKVFTIGCPLDLGHSLSRGVVSNPQRRLEEKLLIQSDLTVNDGNSGGPLINHDGQVLGVVMGSWKEGTGVNFAIPAARLQILLGQTGIAPDPLRQAIRKAAEQPDITIRLQNLQQLSEKHPTSAEVHRLLGETLYRSGDHQQARKALVRAISINPDLAVAYWNLGMVYATGLNNNQSAQQAFHGYLRLQPAGVKAPEIRKWLAAH